ncbi:histidine phosphotransferase family protein [Albidovulum sediminicola]|uniref:Histidine phosphotransferase family protein n=1 Tax=Albidovulum sediminicola TaxID=2984331 RepID=A0ABT2YZ66_9RHOB|nr:histidine phosphotransferase family protein [Defluviimonas sp. WL0075]MCV2864182.1 histidine phosphotransferase family protein [Defluviimonas sp. WL0075]
MPHDTAELAALIGSRMCHDLISPIGAIGNGVELLEMAGTAGPEVTLIAESVAAANARIRFFRIAFGAAPQDHRVGPSEVRAVLSDLTRAGRLRYDWQPAGDQPRGLVKLAFLLLQCCESAMPFGGTVTITEADGHWRLAARADTLKIDAALWQRFEGGGAPVSAAQVQFALAPIEAGALGRALLLERDETRIDIRF